VSLGVSLLWGGCAGTPEISEGSAVIRTGAQKYEKRLRTWKQIRDQHVVMQTYDYSCGAGALATLMRYYFGDPVTEEDVLLNIVDGLSEHEMRDRTEKGLSVLDLKRCAERMGYQAAGVRLRYASLPKLRGPVLIHIEREGYKHFAILRGVRGDRVYLADPSRGNTCMSIDRFACEWTGVALVLGKKGFGLPPDYPLAIAEGETEQLELQSARGALNLLR